MFKLGIRAHDIGKFNAKTLANKVKEAGFEGVQLVFKKAIDTPVDFNDLSDIKDAFNKDVKIMMLGAYFNPVHPDESIVQAGITNFKNHLKTANELNASFVGSETGSYMGSPWGYMPENHTEEALEIVTDIFHDLVLEAERNNTYVALEGAYSHVAYSPKRVLQMVEKINNPHLKVTVDLYNFLNIDNYENRNEIFLESLRLLKEHIVIFHFKDFIVEDGKLKQVGLGDGLMDYNFLINEIVKNVPNAYLIFEGVSGDDIEPSMLKIKKIMEELK